MFLTFLIKWETKCHLFLRIWVIIMSPSNKLWRIWSADKSDSFPPSVEAVLIWAQHGLFCIIQQFFRFSKFINSFCVHSIEWGNGNGKIILKRERGAPLMQLYNGISITVFSVHVSKLWCYFIPYWHILSCWETGSISGKMIVSINWN